MADPVLWMLVVTVDCDDWWALRSEIPPTNTSKGNGDGMYFYVVHLQES
jgi:hypothetical protein